MMHIIRFVLIRPTHKTCFEVCILSQSKVIARKLLVTNDDVTRPPLLIAEVSGAPVNLNGYSTLCLRVLTAWGGFDANQDETKYFLLTYNGEVTKLT